MKILYPLAPFAVAAILLTVTGADWRIALLCSAMIVAGGWVFAAPHTARSTARNRAAAQRYIDHLRRKDRSGNEPVG